MLTCSGVYRYVFLQKGTEFLAGYHPDRQIPPICTGFRVWGLARDARVARESIAEALNLWVLVQYPSNI